MNVTSSCKDVDFLTFKYVSITNFQTFYPQNTVDIIAQVSLGPLPACKAEVYSISD